MHPALVRLLRLRVRAWRRGMVRGLRTVRGAVFFVLGLVTIGLWLGPQLVTLFMIGPHSDPRVLGEIVPLGLLAFTLINVLASLGQEGIPFSAAEVDFLFAGPFTRRQLLTYKLSSGAAGALVLSAVFSLFLSSFGVFWPAGFLGMLLALLFMHWTSTALALVCQTVSLQAYTRTRKRLAGLLVLGVLATVGVLIARADRGGFLETARGLRESAFMSWLLLPLTPLVRTILATRVFPDLVGWASAAAAMDAAILAIAMRLDVNYLESSAAVSQRLYELIQRRRRGDVLSTHGKASWRVPALPRLNGAGPVARRQMIKALRSSPVLVVVAVLSGLVLVPSMVASAHTGHAMVGFLIAQAGVFTLMGARLLTFDFRGDLDHLDWLKSLPLAPAAIVLGQLVTPVLMATSFHLVFLAALAFAAPDYLGAVLAAAGLALPFNFLLFGVENLWFLIFPRRLGPTTPGDFQNVGRTMVEFLAKSVCLGAGFAAAAGVAALGYLLTDSLVVACGLAWLGLAGEGALLVPAIAWALNRFDVSLDTPREPRLSCLGTLEGMGE